MYDENLFYLPGCIHDAGGWLLGGGGGGADSKEGGGTPMQKRNTQHYKICYFIGKYGFLKFFLFIKSLLQDFP